MLLTYCHSSIAKCWQSLQNAVMRYSKLVISFTYAMTHYYIAVIFQFEWAMLNRTSAATTLQN